MQLSLGRPRRRPAFRILALGLLAGFSSADELELNPVKDNTVYEENAGVSNGAGDFIFSGVTATGRIRRALLAFDIAGSIPAGSTITNVSLRMFCSQTIAGNRTVGLYRLNRDWGEGASDAMGMEGGGALAEPGDATWSSTFFPNQTWSTPGGDTLASPSVTRNVGGDGQFYTWSSAGLAADVQAMLDDPANDFGWLVRHTNEGPDQTAKRFDSRSNPTVARRPLLTVEFDPPSGGCVSSNFCSSGPNSTGSAATLAFQGSCATADNSFTLVAGPVPNQPGIFFYGQGQVAGGAGQTFGNGLRCVGGGSIFRLPVTFASGNQLSFQPDLTTPPGAAGLITPGSTWFFQTWYRDPAAGGASFDLSDGLSVTFQ